MTAPGRGNLWTLDIAATTKLPTIFLVYTEIPTEPIVNAIPILTGRARHWI
jgi:hypothetical protein